MKLTDLRGILGYISQFRDKIFVLNIDSQVIDSDNFQNLLLDISVLRSLNIRIVIVHGASTQIERLADKTGAKVSDLKGMGITDDATLNISVTAANRLSHRILEGLRDTGQHAVVTNAIVAHPAGILDGVDHQWTGNVEKVETGFLTDLLDRNIIPVIPPLGLDGNGHTFRVNSDGAALEVSEALRASKLMFVSTNHGARGSGTLSAQFSIESIAKYLKDHRKELDQELFSKLSHGLRACRNGVSRVHVIDGREDAALLNEIFSNEGIGTMIHANEYESVRKATRRDIGALLGLMRESVENKQLVSRSRADLAKRIDGFYVFEIDRNIIGCVGTRELDDHDTAELECLIVSENHANQGIGRKLMDFAQTQARQNGIRKLIALSTQAYNYFQQKGGFREGGLEDLPPARREEYDALNRKSKILVKDLS